jgi:hypothetical protein
MLRRAATVLAIVCAAALLSGCSMIEGLARDATGRDSAAPAEACLPRGAEPDPSPTPAPTLDPHVAGEVRDAVAAVRKLAGVDTVSERTSNSRTASDDPNRSDCRVVSNHFSSQVDVVMEAEATPAQAAAVPTTMAQHLAWTGVSLSLTVPAGPGHIQTTVHYSRTFDQTIPIETSTDVAEGLARLAATPHVTSLEASIPYTMRVDYGSLTVLVDGADPATLDAVRAVIDTTVFADTTLHGSFSNGAKP